MPATTFLPRERADRFSMQNVLFKTSEPTTAEGMVEFFAVSLSLQDISGEVSVVQEIHGWWDNRTGEVTIDGSLRREPETFDSFSHAVDRYCALRIHRARTGFVHSFTWHCFTGMPSNYKRIEVPDFLSSRDSAE
jgi:hypothetical protein